MFDDHTFTVFMFYYLYGSTNRGGLYFTNMIHHSFFLGGGKSLSATNYLFSLHNLLNNNHLIFKYLSGDKSGDTGVGLTIAKIIVGRHRGKIWLKSDIGKVSTLFFSFPK